MNQDDPDYEAIMELAQASGVSIDEAKSEVDGYLQYMNDKAKAEIKKEILKEEKKRSYKRDKRKNKPEFNRMAKKRRAKAKHDAKARKVNRKKR